MKDHIRVIVKDNPPKYALFYVSITNPEDVIKIIYNEIKIRG